MAVASDLPPELVARPLSLVALSGLDITENVAHKRIWESFTLNRQHDRISLTFKLVPFDHQFPKCKPKVNDISIFSGLLKDFSWDFYLLLIFQRTNYDWYLPKGVLKSKWMHKHLSVIPAAMVLFFELEWDHSRWKEKQDECAAKVQQIRY